MSGAIMRLALLKTGFIGLSHPDAPAQNLEHRYMDRSSPLTLIIIEKRFTEKPLRSFVTEFFAA